MDSRSRIDHNKERFTAFDLSIGITCEKQKIGHKTSHSLQKQNSFTKYEGIFLGKSCSHIAFPLELQILLSWECKAMAKFVLH